MFKAHRLEKNDDGYTLILYLNANSVEFAKDLIGDSDRSINIVEVVEDYINNNFKDLKITVVKLILGSVLVSTLILGGGTVRAQGTTTTVVTAAPSTYTVQTGDSLWTISQKTGVSIADIKTLNNLTSDTLYPEQKLILHKQGSGTAATQNQYYTVAAGDSLWIIASKVGVSVDSIKKLNNLTSDTIYIGQKLIVKQIQGISYTVKTGDTLWLIAQNFKTSIDTIKSANNLTTDTLAIGQVLFIPSAASATPAPTTTPTPTPVYNWPATTYIVQPGDTALGVAKKFGTTSDNILKYNYMAPDEWLNAGDKIAISGYAPRVYTVTPGEATAPARVGKLVDWINEGQYLIKRGYQFTIVDVDTGKQFRAQMIGGYNHSDIEPLTTTDAAVMKSLFGTWQWNPRAVVIFINGMNIAASLSGMPHDVDTITDNGVTGHFDMYLLNSSPHNTSTSAAYVQQHQAMVLKAAGR